MFDSLSESDDGFDFPPTDGRMSHRVPDRRDSIDITGFEGCGRRSATRSG
jgi:hypothetical protein